MPRVSQTAGWASDSPTPAQPKELFAQIGSGRITKDRLQSFLRGTLRGTNQVKGEDWFSFTTTAATLKELRDRNPDAFYYAGNDWWLNQPFANKKGKVGVGLSKASDVRNAIRKAIAAAKRRMVNIPLRGTTVPYSVREKFSAAKVLIKPAPPGSGIIAGGPIRVVMEAAGVRDVSGKILGTKNKISNVYATLKALETIADIAKRREK